eukprot:Pgem_evm1s17791
MNYSKIKLNSLILNSGKSFLRFACEHGYVGCVSELIKAGVDISKMDDDDDGISPLIVAVFEGHVSCVKELLSFDCDVEM